MEMSWQMQIGTNMYIYSILKRKKMDSWFVNYNFSHCTCSLFDQAKKEWKERVLNILPCKWKHSIQNTNKEKRNKIQKLTNTDTNTNTIYINTKAYNYRYLYRYTYRLQPHADCWNKTSMKG